MQISVLGPVGVRRADVASELGDRLQRLLAALVTSHGSVVSVDRLIEIVWAGDAPPNAQRTLRTYVTRLRRALDAGRDDVVAFRQPGYVLDLRPGELDCEVFDDELERAVSHLRTADAAAAVELLTTAIGRWRGNAYASFAEEEWARPEAVRLDERLVEARELLVEARLAVGATERAVSEAQALVEGQPLRDRPRALLMRGLYIAGRQAEALRVGSEYRRYLATETGLDPSAGFVDEEARIARGAPPADGSVQILRGYELHERIGEGAFAVVHRATQPGLERDVAIKVIRGELADRPDFIRRFEVEARTVARVEHPNVVPLFDFWREPGAAYLVMRLLRGGSVEQALRARGPYSREQVAQLLAEVGGALETAHRAGVVHRDVRPANLLLDEDGVTYLADFGIALPTATADDLPIVSPAYAAPEVLRGEPAGAAADVLSLGVTVFELLTGRLPFADSEDRAEVIRRQLAEPLPPVRATRTDLPAGIDDVLARATSKAAGDRHASVAALVDDLSTVLEADAATPGRRRGPIVPQQPVENPYVGLHAFGEQDADRYFGRESLVVELIDALERHPMVTVVGASGSGKSSAVRAGLLPAVRRGAIPGSESWFVTTMLPGADPAAALETALLRVAVNPPATLRDQLAEPGGMLRAIKRVLPNERARILIVLDQFEELFTQADDQDERDRFLTELAAAVTAPESPLHVVATLRADHYDSPLRHPALAQLVTDGTVTVRPMTAVEIERAITLPAHDVGIDVESALVADLVAAVTAHPTALPLLQFSLTEVFDRRVAGVMLRETHLDLGGLTGALAARADRIVETGGPGDEAEVRRIFGRLVTLGEGAEDTRRRIVRSELGDGERTAWLVDSFVAARLLATDRDPATREPTVEIAHEALLRDWPRLRTWLDDDRGDLRTLRQVTSSADRWLAAFRDASDLARGSRLEAAEDLAERRPDWLNATEREWIVTSVAAAEQETARQLATIEKDRRQNRRLKSLLGVAASLLVIALVAAVGALVLRNRAVDSERDASAARDEALANEEAARAAESEAAANADAALAAEAEALSNAERADAARDDAEIERLMAVSANQLDAAPDRAILLALEANRRRDDVDTLTAVHRAITTEPRRVEMFPSRFDEPSTTVFSDDGTVGLSIAFSGKAEWFDPVNGETLATREFDEWLDDLAISGDGSVAAVTVPTGRIDFIDGVGGQTVSSFEPEGYAYSRALDRTGQRAAFAIDGIPVAVDVATGEILGTYEIEEYGEIGVSRVSLSEDGDVLYAVWNDDPRMTRFGVDVFDVDTGELLERREEPTEWDVVTAWATGPDGLQLSGRANGVLLISGADAAPVEIEAHDGEVGHAAVNNGVVVTASGDNTVRAWSTDGDSLGIAVSAPGEIDEIGLTATGMLMVSFWSAGWHVIDLGGGRGVELRWPAELARVFQDVPWYETPVDDFAANEYRRLDDNELVAKIDYGDVFPTQLGGPGRSSPDGEWVLGYDEVGNLAFSEVRGERRYMHTIDELHERVTGETDRFSPVGIRPDDGGERFFFLTTRSDEREIGAWMDVVNGEIVDGPIVMDAEGSPLLLDDGGVAIGGGRGNVTILPADLDDPFVIVDGTAGFQPLDQDEASGRILMTGVDGAVSILDPATAEIEQFEGATGDIFDGAFSPDGQLVAVITGSDGLQLYDVASGRRLGVPLDPDGVGLFTNPGLTWSEDGTGVWIAPTGGGLTLLDADPDSWIEQACDMVHRELTLEEWHTFVSPDSEPVAACPTST